MSIKRALVCGAGGFIGGHLVTRLKEEGYYVTGVDIKNHEFKETDADSFLVLDLRSFENCKRILNSERYDEVYQLAADMGGAGYIFTGEHDADIMHNSAQINLNIGNLHDNYDKLFYSSSACIYPAYNQVDPANPNCEESSAYPANPDSEYGWEKLFSERMYMAYARNYGVNVKMARFHNIFGPYGSWNNGKEKAPAAMCRKVAETIDGGTIEIWGDGKQTRSFLYVDECLDGIRRLMNSDVSGPINIGSDEMITINGLVEMVSDIAGKEISIEHIDGPTGVRGRNSDNNMIYDILDWKPTKSLREGMGKTFKWIKGEVEKCR